MKKVIILSGTPGTGKTTIAKILSEALNANLIDINKEVIENQFYTFDSERETKIADIKKLKKHLKKIIQEIHSEYILVEGHYADILPDELVYKAIILRTHPEILKKRLEQKKFSGKKISENLQAEILGDCSSHAYESYKANKIYELNTSKISIDKTINILIALIKNDKSSYQLEKIDWLEDLEKNKSLNKYFD
ncbi:MAG: AAA family ATPase [Candidatus Helarchaeota archaeon]|nr:AAA family ATPase [Candidatus Helarchaeota archaeon]